jgi:exopolyphosphatase / guanosine-5'-triphosphate,3'-diphosphate pyrophosphatase
MRVAIIDLGTNSVRFDVHSLLESGKAKLMHREKLMLRLGQGVFLKGRMSPSAIERTVEAMEHFREIASRLKVRKIVAFGTSALREASDAGILIERVRSRTGIEIRVISGKEEAKLIAQGVLANEASTARRFALVDIGGGSTEISVCRGRQVQEGDSFPLGTARLQQLFLKRSPPREVSVGQLRDYAFNLLSAKMKSERWPACDTILGSSGTVRSLARMLDRKGKEFEVTALTSLVREMQKMTTAQLLGIPRMESKRVDMILSGAILLEEIALALKAKRILATEFSLRDGIIDEEKRLARSHKNSLLELHMDDLLEHSLRFGGDPTHLRHMAELAGELFDRFRPLHGLHHKWRIYLVSAILLRNSGQVISYGERAKHSHYIVMNLDFPSMDGWERELVAQLCLYLPGAKLGEKEIRDSARDRKAREAFPKLLALARVIDALDLGLGRATIRVKRVLISRRLAKITFSGKATEGIEQLMMERKKKLFEELFRRKLVLERA